MNEDDEINAAHPDTGQTFILKGEQQLGPFTDVRITDGLRNGIYAYDDLCWREGMPDWQPLEAIFPKSESQPPTSRTPATSPNQDAKSEIPNDSDISHAQYVARKRGLRGVPAACFALAVIVIVVVAAYKPAKKFVKAHTPKDQTMAAASEPVKAPSEVNDSNATATPSDSGSTDQVQLSLQSDPEDIVKAFSDSIGNNVSASGFQGYTMGMPLERRSSFIQMPSVSRCRQKHHSRDFWHSVEK